MRVALLLELMFLLISSSFGIKPMGNYGRLGDLSPVSPGQIVEHKYYKLAYSEKHEQAIWVFYILTSDFLNSNIHRTNDFRIDAKVKTGSAMPEDYRGSGFDRGHLCPAADMKLNKSSVSETFYMSNISPQEPYFHREIWGNLENQVREWAKNEDTIIVVTGPVFRDNRGKIGDNQVTIPGYYYKVVFDVTKKMKMIALVIKNAPVKKPILECVVSVDSVEKLTGIDFFAGLQNNLEKRLEGKSDIGLWSFAAYNSNPTIQPNKNPSVSTSTEVKSASRQCLGIANSTGKRCRTITANANGYCNAHQRQIHIKNARINKK